MPFRPRVLLLVVLPLLAPPDAVGQLRLMRTHGEESGLAPPVWAIEQDAAGFLWIGAEGGLYRFDGARLDRVETPAAGAIVSLAADAGGTVAAVSDRGGVIEVKGASVRRLDVPGAPGPRTLRMIAYDRAGRLWTIRGGALVHRDGAGQWHALTPDALAGERPRLVRRDAAGGILVATDSAVWRIAGDGPPRRLIDTPHVIDVVDTGDRVLALTLDARLLASGPDAAAPQSLATADERLAGARPIALATRGSMLWLAFDRFLVGMQPDGRVDVLATPEGIDAGGPLFVDRESSLWMGTFTALVQFPEPATRTWTDRQGLPSRHARFLGRTGSTIWVSTWQGVGTIRGQPSGLHAGTVHDWFSQERICPDATGERAWAGSRRGFLELTESGIARTDALPGYLVGCAVAAGGGTWLATTEGLLRMRPGTPAEVVAPPTGELAGGWEAILEDRHGRLWLARNGRICHRRHGREPGGVRGEALAGWVCRAVPETGRITDLVELPDGAIWLATMQAGVLRLSDSTLLTLPGNRELPTSAVFRLVPSRAGGIWLVGHGVLQRVAGTPDGWTVLERLGQWHGLPSTGGQDLLEDADGTLWVTTSLGVVQVPPSARYAGMQPPPVALVEATVDGRRVGDAGAFELPADRNRLELRFAALSFRDRSLLRYQVRPSDREPWRAAGEPSFRWFDLRSGHHAAGFRASLDGRRWSATPATIDFRVLPPWYMDWRVIAAAAALLAAAILLVHRARVRMLLRLERQRTSIALDLHDEIGSGLGSIGILAGVISGPNAGGGAAPERDRRLAHEIARTSAQLGEALGDIVWALDARAGRLEELAARLAEHGNRLCAADDGPEFIADLPAEWSAPLLPLPVRRNVLAVGLEALHNAARHAGATRVRLGLRPAGDGRWELAVEDDGRGMANGNGAGAPHDGEPVATAGTRGTAPGSGRGLPGMRRRAQEIGAELTVGNGAGRGTVVRLRFPVERHAG